MKNITLLLISLLFLTGISEAKEVTSLQDRGGVKYEVNSAQRHSKSQYNLGEMYENGRGVLQDYKESFKWYQDDVDFSCFLDGLNDDKKSIKNFFSLVESDGFISSLIWNQDKLLRDVYPVLSNRDCLENLVSKNPGWAANAALKLYPLAKATFKSDVNFYSLMLFYLDAISSVNFDWKVTSNDNPYSSKVDVVFENDAIEARGATNFCDSFTGCNLHYSSADHSEERKWRAIKFFYRRGEKVSSLIAETIINILQIESQNNSKAVAYLNEAINSYRNLNDNTPVESPLSKDPFDSSEQSMASRVSSEGLYNSVLLNSAASGIRSYSGTIGLSQYDQRGLVQYDLQRYKDNNWIQNTYISLSYIDYEARGGNGSYSPMIFVGFHVNANQYKYMNPFYKISDIASDTGRIPFLVIPEISNSIASKTLPRFSEKIFRCGDRLILKSKYLKDGDWWKAPSGTAFHHLELKGLSWSHTKIAESEINNCISDY